MPMQPWRELHRPLPFHAVCTALCRMQDSASGETRLLVAYEGLGLALVEPGALLLEPLDPGNQAPYRPEVLSAEPGEATDLRFGVERIISLGANQALVGWRTGEVALVTLDGSRCELSALDPSGASKELRPAGALAHMERLGKRNVLISWTLGPTIVAEVDASERSIVPVTTQGASAEQFARCRAVCGVSPGRRVDGRGDRPSTKRWLINTVGCESWWLVRTGKRSKADRRWELIPRPDGADSDRDELAGRRPSFAWSATPLSYHGDTWLVVASDVGLISHWVSGAPVAEGRGENGELRSELVTLQFEGETPVRVVAPASPDGRDDTQFLWVSDRSGCSQLHRLQHDDAERRERRSRSGATRLPEFRPCVQVRYSDEVVSEQVWVELGGDEDNLIVWIARLVRAGNLLLSKYQEPVPVDGPEAGSDRATPPTDSRGDPSERFTLQAAWREVAEFAEHLERMSFEAPERFANALVECDVDRSTPILCRLLDASAPEHDPRSVAGAIRVWTDTIMGCVHRMTTRVRTVEYLRLTRWLHRLRAALRRERDVAGQPGSLGLDIECAFDTALECIRIYGWEADAFSKRRSESLPAVAIPSRHLLAQKRELDTAEDPLAECMRLRAFTDELRLLSYRTRLEAALPAPEHGESRELVSRSWHMSQVAIPGAPGGHLVATVLENASLRLAELKADEPDTGSMRLRPVSLPEEPVAPGAAERGDGTLGRVVELRLTSEAEILVIDSPYDRSLGVGRHTTAEVRVRGVRWADGHLRRERPTVSVPLESDQSVHCMTYLGRCKSGAHAFALGLTGQKARARFAVLLVDDVHRGHGSAALRYLKASRDLPAIYKTSQDVIGNPTTSLAASEEFSDPSGRPVVDLFAGSGDGRVWRIRLPMDESLDDRTERAQYDFEDLGVVRVGRIGAPIWALATRTLRTDDVRGEPEHRVFAGGSNGVSVCWQLSHGAPLAETTSRDDEGRYLRVWATRGDDGVAQIHPFTWRGDRPGRPDLHPAVAVVLHSGKVILLSDADRIDTPVTDERERRGLAPGARLDVVRLRRASHASVLVDDAAVTERFTGRVLRMVTAQLGGQLSAFSLHHPRVKGMRDHVDDDLRRRWRSFVGDWRPSASHGALELDERLVRSRTADLIAMAAPEAPRLMLRELFTAPADGQPEPSTDPALLGVPYYLQPLVRFARNWREFVRPRKQTLPVTRADASETQDASRSPFAQEVRKTLGEPLRAALDCALKMRQRFWFETILEEVLEMTSDHACRLDPSVGGIRRFGVAYTEVINVLEASTNRWRGREEDSVRRVRVSFAKHLLDGDALYRASRHFAEATTGAAPRPRSASPPKGTAARRLEYIDTDFDRPLRVRLYTLQTWLRYGDARVALEALRAGNLTLLRACARLQMDRDDARAQDATLPELPYRILHRYVEAVCDLASLMRGSGSRIDDPFEHEITRTHALVIWAAPSSQASVASALADACAVKEYRRLILDQFELICALGLKRPEGGASVFKLATELREEREFPPEERFSLSNPELMRALGEKPFEPSRSDMDRRSLREERESWEQAKIREFAALPELHDSRYILASWMAFEHALQWVEAMTHLFLGTLDPSRDAEAHRLFSAEKLLHTLRSEVVASSGDDSTVATAGGAQASDDVALRVLAEFADSADFWQKRIDAFERLLEPSPDSPVQTVVEAVRPPDGELDVLRPSTVLLSRRVGHWARKSLDELDKRGERSLLCAPQLHIFRAAFARLAQAAEGFRSGPIVQRDLVLGVLDHGLLESLTEHAFELQELADVIAPPQKTDPDGQGDAPRSTGRSFADHLELRALSARYAPKNLRAIQSILHTADDSPEGVRKDSTLSAIVKQDAVFEACSSEVKLRSWEVPRFRLILRELRQNHELHFKRSVVEGERARRISVTAEEADGVRRVHIECPVPSDDDTADRLRTVLDSHLEWMADAREDQGVPSHGTGLYLAKLAAATVGWDLRATHSAPAAKGAGSRATLGFTLTHIDGSQPDSRLSDEPEGDHV